MAFINRDEQFIEVNNAMCQLTGYTRDELLDKQLLDIFSPDNDFVTPPDRQQMHEGKVAVLRVERKIITKNNSIVYANVNVTTVFGSSGVEYELGVFEDITAQKVAEQEVTALKLRFESIYRLNPIAVVLTDMDSNILMANEKACQLFGYTEQELKQIGIRGISQSDSIDATPPLHDERLNKNLGSYFLERKYIRKDKTVITAELTANVVYDEQERAQYIMGMVVDITERKQKEAALRQSQLMYSSLAENVPGVVYHCLENEHWTMLYLSSYAEQLTGYSAQSFLNNEISFDRIILPEDAQQLKDHAAMSADIKMGDVFNDYYRIQHANGSIRWVHEKGQYFERQDDGWLIYGIIFDITEQKEQEELLRQSEMRFRSIFENSNVPMTLSLQDNWIIQANEAFCKMVGYDMQQVTDLKISDIIHPDSPRTPAQEYEKLQMGIIQSFANIERIIVSRSGENRYLNINLTGIYDTKGVLLYEMSVIEDVTEKRITQIELQQTEALQRALLNAIPDLVFHVDIYGNCLNGFIPDAMKAEIGMIVERMIGKNIKDILPKTFAKNLLAFIHKTVQTRQVETYEYSTLIEGQEMFYESRANAINEHEVMFTTRNITPLRSATIALRNSVEMQEAILKSLPDLTFHMDAQGKYLKVYASPNTELLVPPSQMVDSYLHDLMPQPVADQLMQAIQAALHNKLMVKCGYDVVINNVKKYYEAHINAINAHEVLFCARDITPLKDIQEMLASKVDELEIKNTELQKYISSNFELEHFAYVASHDLREPLRSISSFTQLLHHKLKNSNDTDIVEYLQFIRNSATQMEQLVKDLLEYSRVDSEHKVRTISVPLLMDRVCLNLTNLIQQSAAQVTVMELPQVVIANEMKLTQLFQNLIQNAIKFRHAPAQPVVQISGVETPTHWQFSVSDNGIGIAEEYFENVFMLFKRLNSRSHYSGSGLGLAICKKIVEQHQGKIWLTSEVGKGTVFYFTIIKK